MQIEDIEFNEDVNFTSIKEEIDIANDMFQNMAEFIDSEAKDYGEIGSDIKRIHLIQLCVVCCGSGLSQKAEEEFSSTHSTLEYDYLNAVNETIRNVGRTTVYCISQRYETILCVSDCIQWRSYRQCS